MANRTKDEYFTFDEYRASVLIWKTVPPILISFGTVGNILSIVVLTRKSIKASTTALFLTFLSFSDLLVLYTGLLRQWLNYVIKYDVRHVSESACKIHIWLVYSSLDFSAWILIAVTLERVISSWCPHTAKSKCSRKFGTIVLLTILFFCLGLNSHLLYGMINKISNDGKSVHKCSTNDENYSAFFNLTWPWIDLCVFCLIPFSVILTGNGLILFKVIQSRKKARPSVQPSNRSLHRNRQSFHNHSSMTAMLFTLNMVFLFTTSPVSIYNVGYPVWLEGATQATNASLELWWAVVNMLMYTNNSLNFLLYCLSGSRFRHEVKRLFCPNKFPQSATVLNDFTRTKIRKNSQAKSLTHSLNSGREVYVSSQQNPKNPIFTTPGETSQFNGLADIGTNFEQTRISNSSQGLSTTPSFNASRCLASGTAEIMSGLVLACDHESMQIRNESETPLESTSHARENGASPMGKTDYENSKTHSLNTNSFCKTANNVTNTHEKDIKDRQLETAGTMTSDPESIYTATATKIKTIHVMPSHENDEGSNTDLSTESPKHSGTLTKDEESSVASECHVGSQSDLVSHKIPQTFICAKSASAFLNTATNSIQISNLFGSGTDITDNSDTTADLHKTSCIKMTETNTPHENVGTLQPTDSGENMIVTSKQQPLQTSDQTVNGLELTSDYTIVADGNQLESVSSV